MKHAEFDEFCLACAAGVETRYGPELVGEVKTALWGGSRSGSAAHMGVATVADVAGVASLLVAMISTVVAYIQLRVMLDDKAGPDRSKPKSPKPGPLNFSADVPAIRKSLDEAICDLGAEQQAIATILAQDICRWMSEKSQL